MALRPGGELHSPPGRRRSGAGLQGSKPRNRWETDTRLRLPGVTRRGSALTGSRPSRRRHADTPQKVERELENALDFDLSREDQLLVLCAHLNVQDGKREALKAVARDGIDWDQVLQRAAWQRLPTLLHHHLSGRDLSPYVPPKVLQKLLRIHYQVVARNLLLQSELSRILAAFSAEKIPVIVLKGGALLGTVYQDVGLRPMSDLDVLVHGEQLDRAASTACRQGYVSMAEHLGQKFIDDGLRHLPNLRHVDKGVVLEVHQHIVDADSPYYFGLKGFWDRAQPLGIPGSDALMFSAEDMLLHVSIKFVLDRRYRSNSALGQLCDVAEMVSYHGASLQWDQVTRRAAEYHIEAGLHCALYACRQLLDASIPPEVLRELQPPGFDPSMARLFIRRRVLDIRPWLAHDLVPSSSHYSRRKVVWNIARRLLTPNGDLPRAVPVGTRLRFFRKRVEDVLPRIGRALVKPSELKDDFLLDRWMHELYRPPVGQNSSRVRRAVSAGG